MTDAVHDYKSINRKLNRQEQKAEFEANNPKPEQSAYEALTGGMFGIGAPLKSMAGIGAPLKSMAHPEWPYAGTPFEWSKFVKVKI